MVRLFIFIVFTSLSIDSVFGQMNKWIIQNNVINPEDGSSSLVQGNIAPTDYAENAIFFENGDLALFIKDGNIYNEEGNLIATLLSDATLNCPINNQKNKDISMGYSESLIVQVPGSGCNEFYIITSFCRFEGLKDPEDWSSISMQKNALIYIKVKYDGNKKWHVVGFRQSYKPIRCRYRLSCLDFPVLENRKRRQLHRWLICPLKIHCATPPFAPD